VRASGPKKSASLLAHKTSKLLSINGRSVVIILGPAANPES
ncbi:MAG: hypothetical protein ACI945_002443, partial [Pseudohongiellaceae bacterium]